MNRLAISVAALMASLALWSALLWVAFWLGHGPMRPPEAPHTWRHSVAFHIAQEHAHA